MNADPRYRGRLRRRAEGRRLQLAALAALQERGLPLHLAAAGLGVHVTTATRWRRRARHGEALVHRRGPQVSAASDRARAQAAQLVRDTHALVGADTLRHSVPGLSRREAAQVKTETARALEHERKASAQQVLVSAPGMLRGFDAMEPRRHSPPVHALIAADGCVPYRTSWSLADRYDGRAVFELLRRDFETHGAPLLLRLDRAAQHTTPAVLQLLTDHKVLRLHGPTHYAPFYGQLERQNREHRAWLAGSVGPPDLEGMMDALNMKWRRHALGWRTAAELWTMRPSLVVDRDALREDVQHRAQRLSRTLEGNATPRSLEWRLAVAQALRERGLLRVQSGGWC